MSSTAFVTEKEPVTLGEDAPKQPEPLTEGGLVLPEGTAVPESVQLEEPSPPPRQIRNVPLRALEEERRRRQEVQAELAREKQEAAEKFGRLTGRLEEINRRLELQAQTPPAPEEPEPNADENPRKYVDYHFKRLERQAQQLHQTIQEQQRYIQERENLYTQEIGNTRQAVSEQTRQRQLESIVDADEADAKAELPDYEDAIDFIAEGRDRELSVFIPDPRARKAQIAREVLGTVQGTLAAGESPARKFYEYALARGYKSGQPRSPLDVVRRGQAVSRSLGGAPGRGTAPRRLSLEQLANMSDQEFNRLVPDRQTFRKIHEI